MCAYLIHPYIAYGNFGIAPYVPLYCMSHKTCSWAKCMVVHLPFGNSWLTPHCALEILISSTFVCSSALLSPSLFVQAFPLWQCVLHSMPIFLQWHLHVLQVPGLQLHRFFVKAFCGDCWRAASRNVIRDWSCHPATCMLYIPLNASRSPAWKHVQSTPYLHRRRYIDCAFPITSTMTHGKRCKSVDALSMRGIRTLAYSPTLKMWILAFFACFCCIRCAFFTYALFAFSRTCWCFAIVASGFYGNREYKLYSQYVVTVSVHANVKIKGVLPLIQGIWTYKVCTIYLVFHLFNGCAS